jgi:hypothetical protein
MIAIVLLGLLSIAYGGEELDCDGEDIDNWGIDFVGKSAKFEYYSMCEKDKAFIRIEMEQITEYELDKGEWKESKNKEGSFSNDLYGWDTDNGTESVYEGLAGMANTFRGGLDVDGTNVLFNLTTMLFQEEGSVTVSDDIEQDVYDFTLKFSAIIGDDWPWLSTDNILELCMKIETKEIKSEDKSDDKDKEKVKSYVFGDNIMFDVPKEYKCGDVYQNVTTTVDSKDGLKIEACFTFEYCDEVIYFDPFAYADTTGTTETPSSASKISLLIAYVFSVIFIFGL